MKDKTVSQVLREAADLVDKGWCKWRLCEVADDGSRQYCARGAIFKVVSGNPTWRGYEYNARFINKVEAQLKEVLSDDVVHFNNCVAQKASDVSAAMRIAADLAE